MIITLLTDFGMRDYFVGAMKGVIYSINPEAKIADVTHEIPAQDVRGAAFTLAQFYKTFPPGTVHTCVVDPGVGSSRRSLLVKTENYCFVAPDNGLLSYVFTEEKNFRVFELTNEEFFRPHVSRTFHGRDVFAPVAANLSKGIAPEKFGREIGGFVRFEISNPRKISERETKAEIIHIDHFGNLITNLKAVDLPESFELRVNEKLILKHHKYYAEARKSDIFSIFGSADYLEIVAFQDSAKDLLNVKIGDEVFVAMKKT